MKGRAHRFLISPAGDLVTLYSSLFNHQKGLGEMWLQNISGKGRQDEREKK